MVDRSVDEFLTIGSLVLMWLVSDPLPAVTLLCAITHKFIPHSSNNLISVFCHPQITIWMNNSQWQQ